MGGLQQESSTWSVGQFKRSQVGVPVWWPRTAELAKVAAKMRASLQKMYLPALSPHEHSASKGKAQLAMPKESAKTEARSTSYHAPLNHTHLPRFPYKLAKSPQPVLGFVSVARSVRLACAADQVAVGVENDLRGEQAATPSSHRAC